jgi:predicted dehydrogenase
MTEPLRVGVVGCGLVGRKRAAALGRDRLVGCYDVVPETARSLAGEFGVNAAASVDELLAAACDVVIVAVTHDHLANFACRAPDGAPSRRSPARTAT